MPEVVIVRAVNLPVVLRDARSVDRSGSVDARREFDQLRKVAAVERHILNRLVGDNLVQRGGVDVDVDSRGRDFDSHLSGGDIQSEMQRSHLPDFHLDLVCFELAKTGLARNDLIGTEWQIGKRKFSRRGSGGIASQSRAYIDGLHGGARNGCAGCIRNCAGDSAAKRLRECRYTEQAEKYQKRSCKVSKQHVAP